MVSDRRRTTWSSSSHRSILLFYDVYLHGCDIRRMDHEIRSALDLALTDAIRQGRVLCDNEAAMTEPARSILSVNG